MIIYFFFFDILLRNILFLASEIGTTFKVLEYILLGYVVVFFIYITKLDSLQLFKGLKSCIYREYLFIVFFMVLFFPYMLSLPGWEKKEWYQFKKEWLYKESGRITIYHTGPGVLT